MPQNAANNSKYCQNSCKYSATRPFERFQHWPNEKPVRGARTPNWFTAHTHTPTDKHTHTQQRAHTNLWLHVAFSFRNWANCFVYGRLLFRSTCEIYELLSFHSVSLKRIFERFLAALSVFALFRTTQIECDNA